MTYKLCDSKRLIGFYFKTIGTHRAYGFYVGEDEHGLEMYIHPKIIAGDFITAFNMQPDEFEIPTLGDFRAIRNNAWKVIGFREFIGSGGKFWCSGQYDNERGHIYNFNKNDYFTEYKNSTGYYSFFIRKLSSGRALSDNAYYHSLGFFSHRKKWKKDLEHYDHD